MTKKQRTLEVIDRLKKEYPDADCTLDYDQAWKLLVSVRLAAQCTDARVNVVVQDLFAKYPSVEALAEAAPEEIEAIVKPCGLGRSKARDISACMKMLRDDFGGKIPEDFDSLLKLPGVGRKSANLIMGDVFKKPAIVTDTHCIRLTNRIGLVDNIKSRKKWKWHSGSLFPRKREATSATVLYTTEEKSVQPAQNRFAISAVWKIYAKKMGSESRPHFLFSQLFCSI